MQSDWIEDDLLFARMRDTQSGKSLDLTSWVGESDRRAASESGEFVAVIRTHAAWQTGGLWRDRNGPPESGEQGLNFLNLFSWQRGDDFGMRLKFKLPLSFDEFRIRNLGEKFVFSWRDKEATEHQLSAAWGKLREFMMGQLSGKGATETKIQTDFQSMVNTLA